MAGARSPPIHAHPRLLPLALALLTALAGCLAGTPDPVREPARELVVLAHDGYYVGGEAVAAFERAHDARVRIVPVGSGWDLLDAALSNATGADAVAGLDDILLARADAGRVIEGRAAAHRDHVALNAVSGPSPPATVDDLRARASDLVVPDPRRSTEGLRFLAATVAALGLDAARDLWADLASGGMVVARDAEDAYATHFAGGTYAGTRGLVLATWERPAYEVRERCTDDEAYVGIERCRDEDETMSTRPVPLLAAERTEYVAALADAPNADLAADFVRHAASPAYQEDAAHRMLKRPVASEARAPDYLALVGAPASPIAVGTPAWHDVDAWLRAWDEATSGAA